MGHALDEERRDSLADHFGYGVASTVKREAVRDWEALKACCLKDRDGAVLGWVKEPTLARIVAASGDCRGRLIPPHAAVHVMETEGL